MIGSDADCLYRTIKNTFGYTGILGVVLVFLGFVFWFLLTIGILITMEG